MSDDGMRFTLRPAISDDAPAASRLLAQYGYRADVKVVRGAFERAHRADDAQVIAVTDGDELVGLAVVVVAQKTGRLQALFVSKTRRRQGAGRILLAAAEAVASARGCVLMEAGGARGGGGGGLGRGGGARRRRPAGQEGAAGRRAPRGRAGGGSCAGRASPTAAAGS